MASKAGTGMMKLEEYGKTYEGRPLMLAMVTDPANLSRLEDIRKNNLALAGIEKSVKGDVNMPVVIWLSYNVHGNEASSSEVAMTLLFELLSGKNKALKEQLKRAVIIIDPCLNPDGRDRYVNWYNQQVVKAPNPEPEAIEHAEPWPGGRGNHYYFDLNRDWAWQSQAETRQRLKAYHRWMPSVHVDFHEQYPGSPYYFAPAAEPLHEVITSWQRSFQTEIGKNHARYFDAKGWLYFTREYFDLFYPAYGDTYPMYNGSVGMTYEQAGHGIAGLSIKTGDDTLTLRQRIEHHHATSLSTIEISANNNVKVNSELASFFKEGIDKGIGDYKTYVIQNTFEGKLRPLFDFFDCNGIQWGRCRKARKLKGWSYDKDLEESFSLKEGDILISALQPKSTLIKVLFEQRSALPDSSTYDITAWSIPYAYGLSCYATREKLELPSKPLLDMYINQPPDAYGYLIRYRSFEDGKLLASLLKQGFKVRFTEKDIQYSGESFPKGTLLLLKSGNESKLEQFKLMVRDKVYSVTPVQSGFMDSGSDFGSDKIHLLRKPHVGLVTGKQASPVAVGEVWHLFEQELDYPVTMLGYDHIDEDILRKLDVLVVTDGEHSWLNEKETAQMLKSWVRQGGRLIVMEGAASAIASGEWDIKMKKPEEKNEETGYADIKKYGNRERDMIVNNIPGAIFRVELDNTHPIAYGYPEYYYSLKQNASLLEFSKTSWNVGVIKKEKQISGFVGSAAGKKIIDGTVITAQGMGKGQLICMLDDPLFRSFWQNGKLLFTNAVFLAGQ